MGVFFFREGEGKYDWLRTIPSSLEIGVAASCGYEVLQDILRKPSMESCCLLHPSLFQRSEVATTWKSAAHNPESSRKNLCIFLVKCARTLLQIPQKHTADNTTNALPAIPETLCGLGETRHKIPKNKLRLGNTLRSPPGQSPRPLSAADGRSGRSWW